MLHFVDSPPFSGRMSLFVTSGYRRVNMKGSSDADLLEAYAREESEEAFRELVTRHGDWVYSAAMRQLRNPHMAQEAAQNAFIALAARATRLQRQTIIAGWLHRAVHFCARNLQRTEARRRHWEGEAAAIQTPPGGERVFEELALPHIDGALAELTDKDRDAVVLRFLQKRSVREVAQALGTTEDAAKKRITRALERMRTRLARRGIAISAALLTAGLSEMPLKAAPPELPSAVAAALRDGAVIAAGRGHTLFSSATAKLAAVVGILLLGGLIALWWIPLSAQPEGGTAMQFKLASVMVDDQAKALQFYTGVLGFVTRTDLPVGTERWITVVSPEEPDGTELLLEPMGIPAARVYQEALYKAGLPLTAFMVDDAQGQYQRLTRLGVRFTSAPSSMGPVTVAVFDDTCGNLIQLIQPPRRTDASPGSGLKIKLSSVLVDDQAKALRFYTEVMGFAVKKDVPAGERRWLTVVSPRDPEGTELLLEPAGFPPARVFQKALHEAGIPLTAFATADIRREYDRLTGLGVKFTGPPAQAGPTTIALLDDTCGNWIQIFQVP
jgi:RNA polymerase sigma factor (sigma-70 family)